MLRPLVNVSFQWVHALLMPGSCTWSLELSRTFKEKDRGDGARKRHGQQVRISGSELRELREAWYDFKMT